MSDGLSDEAFASHVNELGIATLEQLDVARQVQSESARKGILVPLSEILVKQGVLTPAMRENVEKKLKAMQAGGLKELGNYKLIKKLGEGGMGAVYLAEDTIAQRKVAIKVLPRKYASDPEFLTRFRREAKAAGKLNHVNIVGAFTVGEDLGNHFYVMEYCDGEPLDARLKREQNIEWDKALEIIRQVARGLKHAHDHGFIHRDIKPANIFMTREGVAKILDLGLSKNIADSEQSFNTQTGVAMGTPHYISPEQARGDKGIDGRTDLYSLGATLYHLVTGQTPFQGTTAAMIMMKHLSEQLPNPQDLREDIPDAVVHVIQKMMAKDPADRYANCAELLEDLDLVVEGKSPSSLALDAMKSSIAMRGAKRGAADDAAGRMRRGAGHQHSVDNRKEDRRGAGRRADDRSDSAQKSKTPLMIAAGVAVLGLIVLVLGFANSSSQKAGEKTAVVDQPKNTVLENSTPKVPEKQSTTVTPANTPTTTPPESRTKPQLLGTVNLTPPEIVDKAINDARNWQPLFTGENLDGFNAPGFAWRLENKAIVNRDQKGAIELREMPKGVTGDCDFRIRFDVNNASNFEINARNGRYTTAFDRLNMMSVMGRTNDLVLSLKDGGVSGTLNGAPLMFKMQIRPSSGGVFNFYQNGSGTIRIVSVEYSNPSPQITEAVSTRSEKAVDLLALINPQIDRVAGRWMIKDKELVAEEITRTEFTRLQIPFQPADEYDYRVEFTRTSGDDEIALYPSRAGRSFKWILGGNNNTTFGLTIVGGRNASDPQNPTLSIRKSCLDNGKRHTALVQIRKDGIKAFLDGTLVTQLATNFMELSTNPNWRLLDDKLLGIGIHGCSATFHRIELLEVNGQGRFTRPDDPAAKDAAKRRSESATGADTLFFEDFEKFDLANVPKGWSTALSTNLSIVEQPGHGKVLRIDNKGRDTSELLVRLDDAKVAGRVLRFSALVKCPKGSSTRPPGDNGGPKLLLRFHESATKQRFHEARLTPGNTDWHLISSETPIPQNCRDVMLGIRVQGVTEDIYVDEFSAALLPKATDGRPANVPDDAIGFQGRWYRVMEPKSWAGAKEECENAGGHLVTITSAEENDFVLSLGNENNLWFGLFSREPKKWEWVTGEPLTGYSNWAPGEPNGNGTVGQLLRNGGLWNDNIATAFSKYVCEWEGPASASSARWAKAVKLVPSADVQQDVVNGVWERRDGALLSPQSDIGNKCKIELPYQIPEEYDLKAELSLVPGGGGADVTLILSKGGSGFGFKFWGRDEDTISGFENVGGQNILANTVSKRLPAQQPGKRYELIVEVRKNSLKGYVDGALVSEWKPAHGELSIWPGWKLRSEDKIGLGSAGARVLFHSADIVDVTGTGKLLRAPTAPPINLLALVDTAKDSKTGTWQIRDGALVSDATSFARTELPYQPSEEFDFRIEFTAHGNPDVNQLLTRNGQTFHWMVSGAANTVSGFAMVNGQFMNETSVPKNPNLQTGRRYESVVQVRKDGLKAFIDGKLVSELKTNFQNLSPLPQARMTDNAALGVLSHNCPTTFHKIEVIEVKGKGKFTRPK